MFWKSNILKRSKKTELLQNYVLPTRCTKFQASSKNWSLIWPHLAKNEVRVMTHFFEARFFLVAVRQNKWRFLIPEEKWIRWDALKENLWFSKFDLFRPELNLTLGQMWKWVSPSNSTSQMTYKSCVTRHSCYVFMRWPHLTRSWPVLSISLLLAWHLCHSFSSIFAEFVRAAVSCLVLAAVLANKSHQPV